MKIRAEPQGSYFNANLRRRKTGESVKEWKNYLSRHILLYYRYS